MHPFRFFPSPRASRRFAILTLLGAFTMAPSLRADDSLPKGPREAAWRAVEKALEEGKPKTALASLAGIEEQAVREKAWAEAARAIATRVLAEAGEAAGDEPDMLVGLAKALEAAPPETRGVLACVRANWTWSYFQSNRWRFAGRTASSVADVGGLDAIDSWDLPQIVAEIRTRFAAALREKDSLGRIPVAEWSALIRPGSMPDAYRPTVWDVIARDAIAFAASGERGLVEPEDAFEIDALGPVLGPREAFLAWRPEAEEGFTDTGSPLVQAAGLYRDLIQFHAADADRTALVAADLDRIQWAAGVAVGEEKETRIRAALEQFIDSAADHEIASLARHLLAERLRASDELVEAHAVAKAGAEAFPGSPGAAQCRNTLAAIEAKALSIATERTWAAPWPVIRATYRNCPRLHLRIVKADWLARLEGGRAQPGWLDDAERKALLATKPLRSFAVDLPAADDYGERFHDIPVPEDLPPGEWWVIASHAEDFSAEDNIVSGALVWTSRLAIVTRQDTRLDGPLSGHVVDVASGEPVTGAAVRAFVRRRGGERFEAGRPVTTDAEGRYEIPAEPGRETVILAEATLGGVKHRMGSDPAVVWQHGRDEEPRRQVVLLTDRGVHRPGQMVFYKGILCFADAAARDYRTLNEQAVAVTFRDANGREIARREQKTNGFGSFSGQFAIPPGSLPGQWAISAEAGGANGGVAVRVEEYKRPKFRVEWEPAEGPVVLDQMVTLPGRAVTYTGLAVSNARVAWRVERAARFPIWCRWAFPWLPFDAGSRRIARGSAVTDADGRFRVTFSAKPDPSLPPDSLPVFSYEVVADATDPSGETRSAQETLRAGYADLEATLSADDWQAAPKDAPAEVSLTILTTSLDGVPRGTTGSLTVQRVVQPAEVDRGDVIGGRPVPRRPQVPSPRTRVAIARPDPAQPETWAVGEVVASRETATDPATGRALATVPLAAGLYRATFEIPARDRIPAIRATRLIEVLDPAADRYGVRRPFALRAARASIEAGESFRGVIGTGYAAGRALVEVLQGGRVVSRRWTEPGRTQWPVEVAVGEEMRGGFTLRAWLVRDGRLHVESLPVDVPWTDKSLSIEWERFTRRLEPAAREVWRARIRRAAPAAQKPATQPEAVVAEMAATLYDQSLDAIAAHAWPAGLGGLLRREWSGVQQGFTNVGQQLGYFLGSWRPGHESIAISYRAFVEPFGPPGDSFFSNRRGGMLARTMLAAGAPMAAEAMMDAAPMAKAQLQDGRQDENAADKPAEGRGSGGEAIDSAAPPPPRRNLAETAFFLPAITSDPDGSITIEFTLPDTLTTWQFRGLAHDASLRSGVLADTCVAAKDLMVEPVVPRFLREGDSIEIPVKVGNRSSGRLTGSVRFVLADTRSGERRDDLLDGPAEQAFDLAAGESRPLLFRVRVTAGSDVVTYRATGSAGRLSDGEEGLLPVLPRRVAVAESVPVTLRGPGSREILLERLAKPADSIDSQSLVVQATSNPAWYAVMAMPSIMEETDEGIDALFNRLYANALARELVTRDERIGRTFEQWRLAATRPEAAGRDPLASPLEADSALVQTLLAETPWVRDAVDESESRARIATLFDATRTANETAAAIARLESLRNDDGGWPWFPGGRSCDSVTLAVVAGFGRLRTHGVAIDLEAALAAIPWIDARLVEEMARGRRLAESLTKPNGGGKVSLTPIGAFALYARSFFLVDSPPAGPAAEAIRWCVGVGKASWADLESRRSQGQLAIALSRLGEKPAAVSVIDSLRQRASGADVKPGEEADAWQGMWWRDPHPAWWSWLDAPIETQAVLIEAFDEVAGDAASVEAMKAWLVSQKRTSRWRGGRATADAVGVLLGRGEDLLASKRPLAVTIGGRAVEPAGVEAGTGFFETRLVRGEIGPEQASIRFTKPDAGIAFGGVHWQYLDDIDRVEAAGREELAIEKRLFVKRFTKAGPVLEPVSETGGPGDASGAEAARRIEVGDEIVVRLVVTSDRDYEFLELADHRPSLTEPVDVLSGWRWGDGVAWYAAVRDASMQFFFERLPRGRHVFEYSLRAAHRGTASSGFARIQSRYAPEFSARSASLPVAVE
jgi:hypothetical protein